MAPPERRIGVAGEVLGQIQNTVLLVSYCNPIQLFGMNVGGIPFANDKEGFWVVIVIVTVLTVALGRLLLIRFRR